MSGTRKLVGLSLMAVAVLASSAMATAAMAQPRTSPPRPSPGGGDRVPQGSYLRTCRGASMNGDMLSAQCTGPTGAPVFSSLDTNGCRGRDIANDRGYLRCGGAGPQPPRPQPPRPQPPRPVPPPPVRPPPAGLQAILYTSPNYRGRQMTVQTPIANLASFRGFNDSIRSIRIIRGRALVCEDKAFAGRCETLTRSTPDLRAVRMDGRISSIR